MQAHRMHIVVPEDHRTTIEFPEAIRSGPVELIVLVPAEGETMERNPVSQSGGRLAALAAELVQDPRAFRDLTTEERRSRLRRLRGAGRGLTSGSEQFARSKAEDIEIEEQRFGR